jgi:beta-glucosidase
VTLRPGQSTAVRFTLTGHDLSYWDDAANGWVLPDGQYQVYVGDSSALAGLPLHGGFTVTRTVGARYATVQAPAVIAAGSTATVTTTLVNDGDYAMPSTRFTLSAPQGWTVAPAGPTPSVVAPGQTVTVPFQVTAPADAQPGTATLNARVSYQSGPGSPGGVVLASTTASVPYSSLAASYNNIGISDNADPAAANFDLAGDSYSAQALAAGTPAPLTPGGQVTVGGTTFTWPNVPAGTVDNVVANGQTIALTGSGTDLGILAASQNGTATGTITVNYTDGTSQSFTLNMADWYANAPATGDQIVTTTSSWNQATPTGAHPVSVYFASVPLASGKTVASVTLPSLPGSFGQTELHVFAVATGSGTPTS